MNLATLGIKIDPSGAVSGAAASKKALDAVGAAAEATANKVDASNKKMGDSTTKAASTSQGAFARMVESITRGLSQMLGVIPGVNRGFAALSSGAASAAVGLSEMATAGGLATAAFVPLAAIVASLMAVLIPFAAVFGAAVVGINKASQMQDAEMSFAVLLGSFEKAKDRMAELSTFAAATPFDLPEVVKASRVLQVFTQGALASGEGLKMVGDAATIAQRGYEEVAISVGRAYAALMGGTPVGEAMQSLLAMGVVAPQTARKLELLQAEGKKGIEVWRVMEATLKNVSGAMEIKNASWSGQMSNLSDAIGRVFTAFGAPLLVQLTPLITAATQAIEGMIESASRAGTTLAGVIATLTGLFKTGTFGELAGLSLTLAFDKAKNFLISGLQNGLASLGPLISLIGSGLNAALSIAASGFGAILSANIAEAAKNFGRELVDAMKNAVNALITGLTASAQFISSLITGQDRGTAAIAAASFIGKNLPTNAGYDAAAATAAYIASGDAMTEKLGDWGTKFAKQMKDLAETAKTVYSDLSNATPLDKISEVEDKINALLQTAKEIGTVTPKNLDKLLPPVTPYDANGAAIDDARKAIKSDTQLMEDFRKARSQISVLEKAGMVSPTEGSRRVRDLENGVAGQLQDPIKNGTDLGVWQRFNAEKQRLDAETSEKMKTNALGVFESVKAGARQTAEGWGTMNQQMAAASAQALNGLVSGFANAFTDIVTGTKSVGDAFASMAKTLLDEITKIIFKLLIQLGIQMAINALTGQPTTANLGSAANGQMTFAGKGKATGGPISGGSGTRDDVPIMAMGGEYMLRKEAVQKYGAGLFDDYNAGRIQKFAMGGPILPASNRSGKMSGGAINVSVTVDASTNHAGGGESQEDSKKKAEKLGSYLKNLVIEGIIEQKRNGGLLSK